jgi:hypothetical protein
MTPAKEFGPGEIGAFYYFKGPPITSAFSGENFMLMGATSEGTEFTATHTLMGGLPCTEAAAICRILRAAGVSAEVVGFGDRGSVLVAAQDLPFAEVTLAKRKKDLEDEDESDDEEEEEDSEDDLGEDDEEDFEDEDDFEEEFEDDELDDDDDIFYDDEDEE